MRLSPFFVFFAVLASAISSHGQTMAGVSPAAQAVVSSTSQPDERAVGELLGQGHRVVATEYFSLAWAGREWPADFERQLDAFCEDFLVCLRKAGFAVNKPAGRLVWVGFDNRRGFDRYVASADRMSLPWLNAYYSTRTNRVAVVISSAAARKSASPSAASAAGPHAESVGVELLHEAAHQLSFNCGLLKRGVMYPLWVTEGLATNFEMGARDAHGANPPRQDRLIWTRCGSEMMPLASLAVATRVPAGDNDEEAHQVYAQSWGLFRFLLDRKPAELKRYLESLSRLPVGRRTTHAMLAEFESAFGPVKDLDAAWDGYVAGLDCRPRVAQAEGTGEGRAVGRPDDARVFP